VPTVVADPFASVNVASRQVSSERLSDIAPAFAVAVGLQPETRFWAATSEADGFAHPYLKMGPFFAVLPGKERFRSDATR
jgi:hypothetical protein